MSKNETSCQRKYSYLNLSKFILLNFVGQCLFSDFGFSAVGGWIKQMGKEIDS